MRRPFRALPGTDLFRPNRRMHLKSHVGRKRRLSTAIDGAREPTGPRGERRFAYVNDPSSIARGILPDPVEPDDLRRWVDMLADGGVDTFVQDVYNQGFTVYWRSDRFQYDLREQHRRFLPMLDAGIQPLQVLLDRSRERGMVFLAGFRMNDTHDFPVFADFIESHPEWHLVRKEDVYQGGKPLDFTFEPVRAFVFEAMREVVNRFDVDGLEMTFRDPGYFPVPHGRERAPLMTDLLRRLRGMLDARGNFQVLKVPYASLIDSPEPIVREVRQFLGREMEEQKMAEVVDPDLYRNRA